MTVLLLACLSLKDNMSTDLESKHTLNLVKECLDSQSKLLTLCHAQPVKATCL